MWKVVGCFVGLALAAACPNEAVRQALRTYLAQPRLKKLKEISNETLKSLLHYHKGRTTGFYDRSVNASPILQRHTEVSTKIATQLRDAEDRFKGSPGSPADMLGIVCESGVNLVLQQTGGLLRPKLIRGGAKGLLQVSNAFGFLSGSARKSKI